MGKILILGNGFDLDLGLKTKYWDFIQSKYFQDHTIGDQDRIFPFLKGFYEINKWVDLEYVLKEYAINNVSSHLHNDFTLLCDSLCDYLLDLDYSLIKKDSVASNLLETVIDNTLFTRIYSYNFTNLQDIAKLLSIGIDKSSPSIEYVHGNIKDRSIILGFEDDAEVDDSKLFMIKSFSPHYCSHNIQYDLDKAEEIIFFGHSLGSTDYHYFANFFQKQSRIDLKEENSKKITIFTYDDKSRVELLTQLRAMNEKRTDLLFNLNKLQILCTGENRDKDKIDNYIEKLTKEEKEYMNQAMLYDPFIIDT